jgi:hypothetical protein
MLLLRKVIFYIFLLLYVILCPLVILYAFGYVFKPSVEQAMTKTGLIYISTAPSGADVQIKGENFKQKTPAIISDILPGNYDILLTLEGYKPWQEAVPVAANKATVLDSIVMIPEKWQYERVLMEDLKGLRPLQGTGYLLLNRTDKLGDYILYNLENNTSNNFVIEENNDLKDSTVTYIYTVNESDCIIIKLQHKNTFKYLYGRIKSDNIVLTDITKLISEGPIYNIIWDANYPDTVFIVRDGYADMIDIEADALYPRHIEDMIGIGVFDRHIYALKKDKRIIRVSYDKKTTEVLLDDKELANKIFSVSDYFNIVSLGNDIICFISEKGSLVVNRLPYNFITKGLIGYELSDDKTVLLTWTSNYIATIDFSKEETMDTEFEKGPEFKVIYEKANNIKNAYVACGLSHIIFCDNNRVYIKAIYKYAKDDVFFIAEVKSRTNIYYYENNYMLYYIEPKSSNLCSVSIMREKSVFTPFPGEKIKQTGREADVL